MTDSPGALRRLIDHVLYFGCASTETDRRNARRLNALSFAWAVAYVGSTYLFKSNHGLPPAYSGLLITVTALLGAAMLWSYRVFLRQSDEMMRKIHLDALAIGFGFTLLLGITWALLEAAGAPPMNMNYLIAGAIFAWMFGVMTGLRRYR